MEPTVRIEDMIKQWTRPQQELWSRWLAAFAGGHPDRVRGIWAPMVEAWKIMMDEGLTAQMTWVQFWTRGLKAGGLGAPEFAGWTDELADLFKSWTALQIEMWDGWLSALEALDPTMQVVGKPAAAARPARGAKAAA